MDMSHAVAVMRQLEEAVPPELDRLVQLQKRETQEDGSTINFYRVLDGSRAPGYLWIQYDPGDRTVLAAEMDVNFPTLIGLNRSPIQLRLTAENVLRYLA